MDAGECLNYIGEKMLLAIFAWGIGKAGLEKILRKLGSWIRTTGLNIGRRRRRIIRNIASWKLNVKCVSVELGNLIGQDMWELESICWGAVVEKLMLMWGVGKDEMKGKHVLPTTMIYVPYACTFICTDFHGILNHKKIHMVHPLSIFCLGSTRGIFGSRPHGPRYWLRCHLGWSLATRKRPAGHGVEHPSGLVDVVSWEPKGTPPMPPPPRGPYFPGGVALGGYP